MVLPRPRTPAALWQENRSSNSQRRSLTRTLTMRCRECFDTRKGRLLLFQESEVNPFSRHERYRSIRKIKPRESFNIRRFVNSESFNATVVPCLDGTDGNVSTGSMRLDGYQCSAERHRSRFVLGLSEILTSTHHFLMPLSTVMKCCLVRGRILAKNVPSCCRKYAKSKQFVASNT